MTEKLPVREDSKVAVAETSGDPMLRIAMIGFVTLFLLTVSAFFAFPSLGAVFFESYLSHYEARVIEAVICR